MKDSIQKITILGDGGWGTTLAIHLGRKDYAVKLWGPFPKYVQQVRKNRYNSKFLPGIRIPNKVTLEDNMKTALSESDLIVFAIPSKFSLSVLKKIKASKINLKQTPCLSVTKGLETKSLQRISQLIQKELGPVPLAVLSGPTIAIEVARSMPSSAVIASKDIKVAKKIQPVFSSDFFRIYTNSDMVGVEIGGCGKNVIAIACGICDGLGFGTNTKAAILTRGLAEISRLGKALGGKAKTFSGLSGLGDMVTTCISPQSRNRFVGEQLGRGKSIEQITQSMEMVAEGIETAKALYKLSLQHNICMPITTEIYKIIYKNKPSPQAVSDLMSRKMKSENI